MLLLVMSDGFLTSRTNNQICMNVCRDERGSSTLETKKNSTNEIYFQIRTKNAWFQAKKTERWRNVCAFGDLREFIDTIITIISIFIYWANMHRTKLTKDNSTRCNNNNTKISKNIFIWKKEKRRQWVNCYFKKCTGTPCERVFGMANKNHIHDLMNTRNNIMYLIIIICLKRKKISFFSLCIFNFALPLRDSWFLHIFLNPTLFLHVPPHEFIIKNNIFSSTLRSNYVSYFKFKKLNSKTPKLTEKKFNSIQCYFKRLRNCIGWITLQKWSN